jgi:hypothetical protein
MILRYLENKNAEFNADIEIVKDMNAQMSPIRSNNYATFHVYSPPIPVRPNSYTTYQTHSPPIPLRQIHNTSYNTHSSRTNPYREEYLLAYLVFEGLVPQAPSDQHRAW